MSIPELISQALVHRSRSLKGLSALVTGASSGIGLAVAARLAQEGCHLRLVARRESRLLELKNELLKLYPEVDIKIYPLDLTLESSLNELEADGAFDVDILLNNAGLAKGLATIADSNPEHWSQMINTNTSAAFAVTQRVAQKMIAKRTGDIIALSSVAAHDSYERGAVYCATKHALRAFHEALRLETIEHGLRIMMISPGMVETEFSLVRFDGNAQRAQSVYQGIHSLDAGDIAESILFTLRQPRHINLDDVIIKPQQQGNPWKVFRKPE